VPALFAKQMADAHFERFGNRPLVFEAWQPQHKTVRVRVPNHAAAAQTVMID
jgi:hypothetical protein